MGEVKFSQKRSQFEFSGNLFNIRSNLKWLSDSSISEQSAVVKLKAADLLPNRLSAWQQAGCKVRNTQSVPLSNRPRRISVWMQWSVYAAYFLEQKIDLNCLNLVFWTIDVLDYHGIVKDDITVMPSKQAPSWKNQLSSQIS